MSLGIEAQLFMRNLKVAALWRSLGLKYKIKSLYPILFYLDKGFLKLIQFFSLQQTFPLLRNSALLLLPKSKHHNK